MTVGSRVSQSPGDKTCVCVCVCVLVVGVGTGMGTNLCPEKYWFKCTGWDISSSQQQKRMMSETGMIIYSNSRYIVFVIVLSGIWIKQRSQSVLSVWTVVLV